MLCLCRERMEELGLSERLFLTGYEPTGRKRINNYFNLRWIEVVKAALSDSQQEMLAESQFRQLILMGSHTFSVMFAHQMLSRQLVTRKLYELWWLFCLYIYHRFISLPRNLRMEVEVSPLSTCYHNFPDYTI